MPSSVPPVVWIVDDDEDDKYLFEIAFKQLIPPVSIKLFNDGEELLPALIQHDSLPSLIILDLNMPRVNGFEALQQLRAEPAFQKIPVIVLTTSSDYCDRERAKQLGANGFLTKPPTMELTLKLFNQLVQEWKLT
ncbi:response regulator [Spirosoma endbachense]|uniref:Response regulator n=1 Tax=Spirosoma endbachense TaxID=2666025 RepID=A0A6P1VPY9_9BACT|nr:response regulator [Spirosoma endbachense]QHV93767.1 response regulator [Spirosoma endbachense]